VGGIGGVKVKIVSCRQAADDIFERCGQPTHVGADKCDSRKCPHQAADTRRVSSKARVSAEIGGCLVKGVKHNKEVVNVVPVKGLDLREH